MKSPPFLLVAASALTLTAVPTTRVQAGIITIAGSDPGFETPVEAASSYNYNATSAFISTSGIIVPPSAFGAPAAPQGSQIGFLQTNTGDARFTGQNGEIDGTLTGLTVGDTYTLSLMDAGRENPVTSSYTISVGGLPLASRTPATSGSFSNFTTPAFVATATTEALALLSTGPTDSTSFVDNLTITDTAVPEPTSLSLLALGGMALLARRRRA